METTTAQAVKPTFEMVTKDCQNCNRPFKVLSTSKTTTCSRSCMEAQGIAIPKPDFVKMAALRKKLAAKGVPPSDELMEAVENFVEDVDPADETEFDEDSRPRVKQIENITKASPATTQKPIAENSPKVSREFKPNETPVTSISAASVSVVPLKRPQIELKPQPEPAEVRQTSHKELTKSQIETKAKPHVRSEQTNTALETPTGKNKISAESLLEKWAKNVEKAKAYVLQISKCRLQIAELALEVCDVRWGGGAHWNSFEGTYTLKQFAEEIGVNPKTLSNWVRVKRNVHDKLIEAGETVDPVADWSAMTRVADRMKHDADPATVKASFASWDKKRVKAFNHAQYVLQMRRKTKSFRHFVENVAKPGKIDGDEIQEMRRDMQAIIKWVRDNGSRFA